MARTEAVLEQAERSGVAVEALPELQSARNKFADAQIAFGKKSESGDRVALQLARQAEVDAQYASAKAQSQRQQDAAREVREGVNALREEAQRGTVSTSPPVSAN